jgi:hypothetical protein
MSLWHQIQPLSIKYYSNSSVFFAEHWISYLKSILLISDTVIVEYGDVRIITSPIYRTRSIARPPCNGLVAGISRDGGHVFFGSQSSTSSTPFCVGGVQTTTTMVRRHSGGSSNSKTAAAAAGLVRFSFLYSFFFILLTFFFRTNWGVHVAIS